jgi:hypothetical protein
LLPPDYNSAFLLLPKNKNSIIIPDDVPALKNYKGKAIFGVTAVDDVGNESDMLLTKTLHINQSTTKSPLEVKVIVQKLEIY